MNVSYFLTIYNSRPDIAGNCYYAFELVSADNGNVFVQGKINGGESNITMIRFGFSTPNEFDRSIVYSTEELPIRQFNRMVKDWPYAGSHPDDIRAYIKRELKEQGVEA